MLPYPNYTMPMNSGYTPPISNPYQQRMDFLQGYQQSLQPTQPTQQIQNIGINGKIVPNVESITANDVPMDGSVAVFPKQDMSEIYVKFWENNGTIRTIVFKPILGGDPSSLSSNSEKAVVTLSEDVTGAFMQRFDGLEKQINELMNKSTAKPTNSKAKKDGAENE